MKRFTAALFLPLALQAAASFTIVIGDPPGVGFNDPTPVAPIGGNPGTTLGQQRLNVFIRAAQIWGATLTSTVDIKINGAWPALFCDATSAVLGQAGPSTVHANSPGLTRANVFFPQAVANKLANADLHPLEDIFADFNGNLGKPGCLPGRPFYLGLDGNPPLNTVHFLTTLLHEFGHGLGFLSTTNPSTGQFLANLFPSIYDVFLLDKTTNQTWAETSAFARSQSAINGQGKLVWDGPNVKAAVPTVLSPAPLIQVTAPASASANYIAGPSTLGPSLASPVNAELMPVVSNTGGGNACAPLTGFDAAAVNNKVAIVDRGGCPFYTKILNAQNAGARGVLIVNNTPDFPPQNITDLTPGISIPNVLMAQEDGNALKALLRFRSRTASGIFVRMGNSPTQRAGADSANRTIMYAPSILSGGSSVSHYDVSLARNQLMEPFINVDLSLSVKPPQDLTFPLLQDLGW